MELELNKKIKVNEDKLNQLFEKFKKVINLILSFNNEPDNTAEKISQDPDLGLQESFKDIKAGLLGEFTRSQTIDIAINKLTTYLGSVLEEFKSLTDTLSLNTFIQEVKKETSGYTEAVLKNVSPSVLTRRKERYLENSLTRDFLVRRAEKVLVSKLSEFGTAKLPKDILFSFREIVSMINLCETTKIDETNKDVTNRKEYIKAMYSRIGDDDFNKELFKPKIKPEELRSKYILDYYIEKIDSNDTTVTEIEVINSFIDNLERYMIGFKDNLDHISQSLSGITNDNGFLEEVLVDIINNLVIPYVKGTITQQEFTKKLTNSFLTVQNLLVINKDLRTIILNTYISFLNNLDMFNIIYSTMDEITFAGTLKETGEVNKEPIVK